MKKIKLIIKDFFPTLKKYVDYLMNVGYKDLFINTVVIFCLILLAAFIYVPIGLLQDVISSTIQLLGGMSGIVSRIYYWIFNILSAVCAVLIFMWLFNKRFEHVEKQVQEKTDGKNEVKDKEDSDDNFDLPKAKKK